MEMEAVAGRKGLEAAAATGKVKFPVACWKEPQKGDEGQM